MDKRNLNKKVGTSLLMSALLAGTIMVPMSNAKAAETPEVKYSVHVEDHAWMKEVSTNDKDAFAGTKGEARRMEAIRVKLEGLDDVTLRFKLHIEDYGDREFTEDSKVIGTEGEAKRLEGITIYADGLEDTGYKLQYRVHIENEGDQEWKNAGEFAGSRGKAQRLESIQFRLVSEAEEELETAKKDAIAQLESQFKASDYTIKASDFKAAMDAGKEAINKAENVKGVIDALKSAKTELEKVTTDKEELSGLETKKNENVATLVEYIKTESEKATDVATIKSAIEATRRAGTDAIDNASSITAADDALKKAKENVLTAATKAAKTELDKLFNEGKEEADKTVKYLTLDAYNTAMEALKEPADVAAVVKAYKDAVVEDASTTMQAFDKIKEEVSGAFKTLTDQLNGTDYAADKAISAAVETGTDAIDATETRAALDRASKDATNKVLSLVKSAVTADLNKLYNGGNPVDGKILSRTDYNTATKAIADAKDIDTMITALTTAKGKAKAVAGAAEAIADLKAIVAKSDISAIVSEAEKTINSSKTASAIAAAKEAALDKILAAEKSYYLGEVNKNSGKMDTENSKYYTSKVTNDAKNAINEAQEFSELATIYAQYEAAAAEAYTAQ